MTARDELATMLSRVPHVRALHLELPASIVTHAMDGIADAILAAGYRKTEPKWSETLNNDGTYEYTVTSDCAGSNVQHWRRVPGRVSIEDAMPWEAYNPESQP